MSHSFVWVDIPATDLDRAIAFYAAVLGSAVTKEGGPGNMFGLFPHSGDDVAGCVYVAGADNPPSRTGPLIYLNGSISTPKAAWTRRCKRSPSMAARCCRRPSRSARMAGARW